MTPTKTKLHIERLNQRHEQERLLIASGAIFQLISSQIEPVSEIAIAMYLEISVVAVRKAIAELLKDGLIEKDFQGNWEAMF